MREVIQGSADISAVIRIVDEIDGTPETGVTAGSAGLDLKYRREGAATVNLTESNLAALTTAHTDGGMIHIGAGYYRVDLPDLAVARGADGVLLFGTVTGMIVIGAYIPLVPDIGVARGTCAAGASVTSVPTSSVSPAIAIADQYRARVMIFEWDTTTATLRGTASDIIAHTLGGTFTVSPLPAVPASGDRFMIV